MKRPPIKKPQIVEPNQCDCGDHAWVALTRGFITIVSPKDVDLLRVKWHAHHSSGTAFYAFRTIHIVGSWDAETGKAARRSEYLHRVILGQYTDHENGNTLDNRRTNLRPATQSQNQANRRKLRNGVTTSSKFKGVTWDIRRYVWIAQLAGKYIGRFDSEKDAARAYDTAAVELYGKFARINGVFTKRS